MSNKNPNWVERDDGWHKLDDSLVKGNADYFARDIPPVRDAETGYPIGKDGQIDWGAVIRENNEKHNGR